MKKVLNFSVALTLAMVLIASLVAVGCQQENPSGTKTFTLVVVHEDDSQEEFVLTGAASTVGEALLGAGIISGEEGAYGLYVLTVDGETHKWEDDGKYWAFYIGETLSSTGVDQTPIEDGATYYFKVQ